MFVDVDLGKKNKRNIHSFLSLTILSRNHRQSSPTRKQPDEAAECDLYDQSWRPPSDCCSNNDLRGYLPYRQIVAIY